MKRFVFRLSVPTILLILFSFAAFAQRDQVKSEIMNLISAAKVEVGFAWKHSLTGDTFTIRGNRRFPMQSVYKFPLALAIFDQIDKGKLTLGQKIWVTKSDYWENTWSPLMKMYPDANIYLSLEEILRSTASNSDNVGCDILFRLMGGPQEVEKHIHSIGVNDIAMRFTEREMHEKTDTQFENWCTPSAMAQMLDLFDKKQLLSDASQRALRKMMEETATGGARIKGLLPEKTIVAHKTGSSGTDQNGVMAAVNDVGIISLPDGSRLILVFFLTNSSEGMKNSEYLISRISKIAFEHFSAK